MLETIKKILNYNNPLTEIIERYESKSEFNRIKRCEKLYSYYIGDSEAQLKYLERALLKSISEETVEEMQKPFINIVNKVINRQALAYIESPDRYLTEDKSNDTYQELLATSKIKIKSKEWNKLAKLFDCVLVEVCWRDKIEYDILLPQFVTIIEKENNYLEIKELLYAKVYKDEMRYIHWDTDTYHVMDKNFKLIRDEYNPENQNPYGVIPFLPLRLRETESFWGEGDIELVDINEKINVLLASSYFNSIMQSHGQPIAINMGIKGKIKTGANHIIQVEGATSDFISPSFTFVQPNPSTTATMEQIDYLIKMVCVTRGLPAFSVSTDATAQSGVSKAIDSAELYEMRQNDIERLEDFEKDLFNLTKIVFNYNSNKQINDDSFNINFPKVEPQRTEEEQLRVKQEKLKLGLWTPIDDIINEEMGIDKEKAMEIIRENLAVRNILNDEFGLLEIKPIEIETEEVEEEVKEEGLVI